MKICALLLACGLAVVAAQQIGTNTVEQHPPLPVSVCTKRGCKPEATSVVLDSNYRWVHQVGNYLPCKENGKWNATVCPDPQTCVRNCEIEGLQIADYKNNYGVTTSGSDVTLSYTDKFAARLYILDKNDKNYRLYKMLGQEISFDLDTSNMDCGMNGGVFFASMDKDGGMGKHPTNKVGARYGTGYCDAQCTNPPMDFINGQANFGAKTSTGTYGLCCTEMDLWEFNRASASVTSHVTNKRGAYVCNDDVECGIGSDNYFKSVADKNGCGFNSYLNGEHNFFGVGSNYTVDSSKRLTVVTQFITDDKTTKGTLVEIRRKYVQNGKVIANTKLAGTDYSGLTDAYCAQHDAPNDVQLPLGGLKAMGEELGRGVVLAFTIWADGAGHMTWLDSGNAGPCPADSGDPAKLQAAGQSYTVGNIRIGDIDSTYGKK